MKKTNILFAIFGVLLFGLSGCAVTDFDRTADFRHYKTYTWGESDIEVSNPIYESDLIEKRIVTIVEDEFARRGIVKNDADPDFIVRYHTYTEEKQKQETGMYPYHYRFYPFGFYPYAFGWGYPYSWMAPRYIEEFTEGTLILDIIDRDSNEVVWRGSISGNVDDVSNLRKQIEKGVKAIMKKYPVTPEAPLKIVNDPDVIS